MTTIDLPTAFIASGTYERTPSQITAVQWRGDNLQEVRDLLTEDTPTHISAEGTLHLFVAPEDTFMRVPLGHVIVTADGANAHPVAPAVFRHSHTPPAIPGGYSHTCLDGRHMDCRDPLCGCHIGTHNVGHGRR